MRKSLLILLSIFISVNALHAQTWAPLGSGVNDLVQKLMFDPGTQKIYAGGDFSMAGGLTAKRVATWDFSSWSAVPGSTFISNPSGGANGITGFGIYNNLPVMCGFDFTNTSTLMGTNRILQNDGIGWSAVGNGLDGPCLAVLAYNNDLYCAGQFVGAAGAGISSNVTKWNGTTWDSLGNGITGVFAVYSLAVYNGEIYAGARVNTVQSSGNKALYKFDGTDWTLVNINTPPLIFALQVYNNELYLSGTNYSGSTGSTLLKYNGTTASDVVSGATGNYQALNVYKGNLYVGGLFSSIGGVSANNIAKWDGTTFSALGTGTNGVVYAIASDPNYGLIAGGDFTTAGGNTANNIAIWDNSTGINDLSGKETSFIFPNPSNGKFVFSNGGTDEYQEMIITNVLGKVIYGPEKIVSNECEIDLSSYGKGIYFLNIQGENSNHVKKIVVE